MSFIIVWIANIFDLSESNILKKSYYYKHPNTLKFSQLINSKNRVEFKKTYEIYEDYYSDVCVLTAHYHSLY